MGSLSNKTSYNNNSFVLRFHHWSIDICTIAQSHPITFCSPVALHRFYKDSEEIQREWLRNVKRNETFLIEFICRWVSIVYHMRSMTWQNNV